MKNTNRKAPGIAALAMTFVLLLAAGCVTTKPVRTGDYSVSRDTRK
jgi:hypothetical protein